ncbi:AtpZ/AtpI family protein [Luteococcus sediminum]
MDTQFRPPSSRQQIPLEGSQGDGMIPLSYVLSGIMLYGGLGWLGSRYLHQGWMLPTGLIVGLVMSMYLIIKRYGRPDETMNSRGVDQ